MFTPGKSRRKMTDDNYDNFVAGKLNDSLSASHHTASAADDSDGELNPAMKQSILVACLASLTVGNMMINNVLAIIPDFIT